MKLGIGGDGIEGSDVMLVWGCKENEGGWKLGKSVEEVMVGGKCNEKGKRWVSIEE